MDEYRIARMELMAEVSVGRQRLGWMDDVKVAFGNRGILVEAVYQCAKDQKEWRAEYICSRMSFPRPFLLDPVFFRTSLMCSGGYHLERVGMNCTRGANTE